MNGFVSTVSNHKYKIIIAVLLLIAAYIFFQGDTAEQVATETVLPVVTVTSAAQISGEQEVSLVGTVRAFSEAVVTAEATGRVTSVNATLGQTVPAGFVVATLENAAEQAAVLQAEGSYEAALAAAEQSNVGLDEALTGLENAQNNAISTFQSSYTTVNGVIQNNVDTFFTNPESAVPGVRIENSGQTAFLNSERVAYQTILSEWLAETTAMTQDSNLTLALADATERVERTVTLVDVFISIINSDSADNSYTDAELLTFSTTFNGLRESLQGTLSSINNASAALDNASDAVRRAEISSTGNVVSASDAQVKQALGSLRAAQANLANTILRTPISGTVNTLDVRVGDFVSNQQVVARVANNNALEIVTFVGDNELPAFSIGGTVVVEDSYEGVVTEVAPAVDPVTRKTEVRIAIETEDVQNGDTVSIGKTFATEAIEDQPVFIPLSAVKFEIEDGFIFVVENNRLVPKPVELGTIRGGSVQIVSGLTQSDEFVVDARGLLADTEVEVRTQ